MNDQLCLVCPNLAAYSETFIKDQIAQLQPGTLIYEGNYPIRSRDQDWQLPFPFNIHAVKGIAKKLAPGLFHRIYSRSLANYLRKRKVTALLANYGPVGVSVVDACVMANVKLVVHFHGFDAYEYSTIAKFRDAYLHMFTFAHRMVAVSTEMKKELIKLGAEEDRIVFIPCGIDLERFTATDPSANGSLLINIGRFTPKKAPDQLIRAFKIVHDILPDARLKMIGGGELLEEVKALAVSLGLSDAVTFAGIQSPEEIIRALHQSRIYVQHSLRPPSGDSEGTPVSVMEASACGLPVVSTRHAGIRDAVLEQVTGLLVDEGDVEGMAKNIITLLKDPALCKQMGIAGRAHMGKNYNFSLQTAKLAALLEV